MRKTGSRFTALKLDPNRTRRHSALDYLSGVFIEFFFSLGIRKPWYIEDLVPAVRAVSGTWTMARTPGQRLEPHVQRTMQAL